MQNVDIDGDHARLVEAIPRHMRKDGTVNLTSLGAEFGLHRSNMKPRVAALSASGALGTNPVLPGFMIKSTSTQYRHGVLVGESVKQVPEGDVTEIAPKGFAIKGVSTLRDAHGRTIVEWTKTREEKADPIALVAGLEAAFAEFKPAAIPAVAPDHDFADKLAIYPWADPHFGVMVWGKEASRDWDLKIAVRVTNETFTKLVGLTPATKKAILLVGGDTQHSDNNDNTTNKSGNALQVDGRYPKIMLTSCETIVRNTDLLLTRHEEVELIVLPGNHDEHSAYAIAFFLHAWYRNEPRVTVDISPSLFRFREFGKVMIGTTHGHTVKIKDMAAIMAARQPAMWGRTVHRFALGFHVHHAGQTISEGGGVVAETFQIVAPQDAWHWNQGYLSGRSLQSIVYDREHGEVGRSRVALV